MSQKKQASKRRLRGKAVPVLGAAGLSLTLASGASALPATDAPTHETFNHEITLADEEICDVSLATFYVVDKENAAPAPRGGRLAMAGAACGCGGCACGSGCWTGTYYTSSVFGGNGNPQPQHAVKPARKYKHARKAAPAPKTP